MRKSLEAQKKNTFRIFENKIFWGYHYVRTTGKYRPLVRARPFRSEMVCSNSGRHSDFQNHPFWALFDENGEFSDF